MLPPVQVYNTVNSVIINKIKQSFPPEINHAFLCWDEMEIRAGLVWNGSTRELIERASY